MAVKYDSDDSEFASSPFMHDFFKLANTLSLHCISMHCLILYGKFSVIKKTM